MSLVYGVFAFLGLIIYVLGIEVYLDWTKRENQRLREVARRRAEMGMEK